MLYLGFDRKWIVRFLRRYAATSCEQRMRVLLQSDNSLNCADVHGGPEKNTQSLMHRHYANFRRKTTRFASRSRILTGNTKKWHFKNNVIKYFGFDSC